MLLYAYIAYLVEKKSIIKGFTYIPLLRIELYTPIGAHGTQYRMSEKD
jgi:hypothetical protein